MLSMLLYSSLSDAVSGISTAISSCFSIITGNWALACLIGVPIVFMIVGGIIGFVRGR